MRTLQTMDALRLKYPFLRKRLNPYPSDAHVSDEYTKHLVKETSFNKHLKGSVLFSGQTKSGMDYWGLSAVDPSKQVEE